MSTDSEGHQPESESDSLPHNGGGKRTNESHDSSAGAPVNSVLTRPTDEDLDQRNRDKSRPRRAAGPLLRDDAPPGAPRDDVSHEPPPATDPSVEASSISGSTDAPATSQGGGTTKTGDAGRPVDHAGPKPSDDDLDRRDRKKAGPRRAAGPLLRDDAPPGAPRDNILHEPPPPTDPQE